MGSTELPLNAGTAPDISTEAPSGPEMMSSTAFISDADVVVSEMPKPKSLSEQYLQHNHSVTDANILTYLGKPVRLAAGLLDSADTATTFPGYAVPHSILNRPLFLSKLKGFFGFRATTVLTVHINATRFQQGRYMLTWVPLGGTTSDLGSPGQQWVDMHSATLTQRTTLPRVEFDLNCDTSAELRIPFASTQDYFPLSALNGTLLEGSWGHARIFPYSPLNAVAGSTSCAYTLWAHFEDIELIGPSVPQGAVFQSAVSSSRKKKKNLSQAEAKSQDVGPVESMALKIGKAAQFLTPIPVIGAFASQVPWVTDIVANVASVFGWSRPINLHHVMRNHIANMPYSTNINAVDNSFPLSLDVKNQVGVMPGFSGTDTDEMDITYLAQIPFWNYTAEWTTLQIEDTPLIEPLVAPFDNIKTQTYGVLTANHYGPCQYLTQKFAYWRGSMRYRLKFVKTEFHSGRLAISFTPYSSMATRVPTASLADTDYTYRDVIDIRETNEYEFTVPYVSETPYLMNTTGAEMGQISIRVIDPLVAPDTVASSVEILIEMSMGPDAEFALLNNRPKCVVNPIVYQSAVESNSCALGSKMIGDSTHGVFQTETAQAAIGEKIISFRALLKKFTPILDRSSIYTPARYLSVHSHAFAVTDYTAGGPALWVPRQLNDLLGELTSFYAFSRGSVRLKYDPGVNSSKSVMAFIDYTQLAYDDNASAVVQRSSNTIGNTIEDPATHASVSTYVISPYGTNTLEVQTPQYTLLHSRANADLGASASRRMIMSRTSTVPRHGVTFMHNNEVAEDTIDGNIYRATGDDHNLSGFISIPPLL